MVASEVVVVVVVLVVVVVGGGGGCGGGVGGGGGWGGFFSVPTRSKAQFWAQTIVFIGHLEATFSKEGGAAQARAMPGEKYDSVELLRSCNTLMLKDCHAADTLPEATRKTELLVTFQSAFTASLPSLCSKYGDVQLSSLVKIASQLALVLSDLPAYHTEANSHDVLKQKLQFLISDLTHRFDFALDGVAAKAAETYQELYLVLAGMVGQPLAALAVVAKLSDIDFQADARIVSDAMQLEQPLTGYLNWPASDGPHAQFVHRGLFYLLPNFGQFHILHAKCQDVDGPESEGYSELLEKASDDIPFGV